VFLRTMSLVPIFAIDRVRASSTGAAIFGPTKCVKYASGASAGVLEYGCLRLFLQPKLTKIFYLPINSVSPTHFVLIPASVCSEDCCSC
jgi:hypothetical protein